MIRKLPVVLALSLVLPATALAQQKAAPQSAAAKIANAMSAAPTSIASNATIMDWPSTPNGKPTVLRKGTNGWVCFPKAPAKDPEANDPMCLDATWQQWAEAYMSKKPPKLTTGGIAYMIAPGGAKGSGTDPFAEKGTPTNDWGYDGPHVMILYPNADAYKGL
ncbi:MAG TPA: hypothetical protein VF832_02700, partial [Longimicrobiales bacterium]